jgi:mannose-6-phosphate isomerase-like protein (cupin superfamily)
VEVRNLEAAEAFTTKDGSTIRELLHTPAQSLAEATLAPRQATDRHHHRDSEELYFFLDGGGRMEVDGAARDVIPGDAVLIPPGAWHQLVAGPDGARFLCMCAPPYTHDDTFLAEASRGEAGF